MLELMDGFLKSDQVSLQKDILDHVEYTVSRWGVSFDDFEAYQEIYSSSTYIIQGFPPSPESSGQLRSRANIG
ncbi:uncharacterized protein A4U43_C03F650 [Asparagus officinalis]|uniref:Uncharacterized protein n=1 Tax=Asparagus officinalis TaxID=4686 RepID=A0A5P1F6T6_ASPOF|nr:uncharacterized protein A4U43_C03F650 [Asparagus officinalis]